MFTLTPGLPGFCFMPVGGDGQSDKLYLLENMWREKLRDKVYNGR